MTIQTNRVCFDSLQANKIHDVSIAGGKEKVDDTQHKSWTDLCRVIFAKCVKF